MPEPGPRNTTTWQSEMLCEDGNSSKRAWPGSSAKIRSRSVFEKSNSHKTRKTLRTKAANANPSHFTLSRNLDKGSTTVPRRNPTTIESRSSRFFLTNFLQGHFGAVVDSGPSSHAPMELTDLWPEYETLLSLGVETRVDCRMGVRSRGLDPRAKRV